jgi:hypothetical protein
MNANFVPEAVNKDQLNPTIRSVKTGGLHSPLRAMKASEFAASWVEAWNSRNLDCIIEHYSEDVVLSSCLVRTIGGVNSDTIRGGLALRSFFSAVLRRFPSASLRLRAVYSYDEGVVLLYDSVKGLLAC